MSVILTIYRTYLRNNTKMKTRKRTRKERNIPEVAHRLNPYYVGQTSDMSPDH